MKGKKTSSEEEKGQASSKDTKREEANSQNVFKEGTSESPQVKDPKSRIESRLNEEEKERKYSDASEAQNRKEGEGDRSTVANGVPPGKPFIPEPPGFQDKETEEPEDPNPNSNPNYSYYPSVAYPSGTQNSSESEEEE